MTGRRTALHGDTGDDHVMDRVGDIDGPAVGTAAVGKSQFLDRDREGRRTADGENLVRIPTVHGQFICPQSVDGQIIGDGRQGAGEGNGLIFQCRRKFDDIRTGVAVGLVDGVTQGRGRICIGCRIHCIGRRIENRRHAQNEKTR